LITTNTYELVKLIIYTITNLAEHLETISHDVIDYYLKTEKLTSLLLWDKVKEVVEPDGNGYIIFDDSVLDKRYSEEIEMNIVVMNMAYSKELV
jgi:hypothetical protein